ncbi:prolipoprotein diacylglyceryl transferase family protein [Shigella flexneri]
MRWRRRLGNFINGELWGHCRRNAACRLPCVPGSGRGYGGCCLRILEWRSSFNTYGVLPRHMSQLWLALEGVVLFIILNLYIRKPPPMGAVLVCS